jgi:lambda repressor-like predicted transcriptional regulator
MRAYSNPSDQVEHLRSLLELPQGARRERRQRPPKQAQTRLSADQVDQLVAAHRGGVGVKKLAVRFGIHRDTVHNLLVREGAFRRRGIHPGDFPEVIRLYQEGWSMARLASKFDVSPSTVTNTLRKMGVRN